MGQAALHADGSAAQPRKAGGSSLRNRSRATDSKPKVRKICCTTLRKHLGAYAPQYFQLELRTVEFTILPLDASCTVDTVGCSPKPQ
jgi:hypothetical protein